MTDRDFDRDAESRCTHETEWVGTSEGLHQYVEACWKCIFDVYFEREEADA